MGEVLNVNRMVRTMERRARFLRERISDYKGKSPSYDQAEASALELAAEVFKRDPDAVRRVHWEVGQERSLRGVE